MLSLMAGLQFTGKRDLYGVFGYNKAPTYDHMLAKYTRQDITKRVVDEPVRGIWVDPPIIKIGSTEGPNSTWEVLQKKHNLWNVMARADKLCAFGEFSILLLGLKGSPEKPASANSPLLYVQPYGTKEVIISEFDLKPTSPRFGLPLMYTIKISGSAENSGTVTPPLQVHYSRVVHITDPLLVDNSRSVPRLLPVYNILDDLLKVGGGSAEIYWLNASRGMQVNVDKDMDLNPADAKDLSDELEEYQHQLRRYIRTRGVEINTLKADVTDPTGTFGTLIKLLSGATGIPQRILLGAEAGQLASEQDRANWAVQIEARRKEFAEPYVLRPFIIRMMEIGALPKVDIETAVEFVWPEAFKMSPLEDSQQMAQTARAIVNLSRQAQEGHPIVSTKEARAIIRQPPESDEKLPTAMDAVAFAQQGQAKSTALGQPGKNTDPNAPMPDGTPNPDNPAQQPGNPGQSGGGNGTGSPGRRPLFGIFSEHS
jgi:hypothetical protein